MHFLCTGVVYVENGCELWENMQVFRRAALARMDNIRYNMTKRRAKCPENKEVLSMKELQECRAELDALDRELVALFEKRMAVSRDVAAYKLAHGLPVLDRSREEQVLESRCAMLQDASLAPSVRCLFEQIMKLSREEQNKLLQEAQG